MLAGDAGRLRVAIIGLGPKGLFALERLSDQAHRAGPDATIDVDLFEPHLVPGAGPVYDPGQPEYLRMNFAADQLDIWPPDSRAVPPGQRRSFCDWRGGGDDERYASRSQAGRYLADGLEAIIEHAPPTATITLRAAAVRAVRRHGARWIVATADDATDAYDEVLVAIGHSTCADRALAQSLRQGAPLIPAVFPVTTWLTPERVPAGVTVAVRGFALTFLDAAIALTEGRGGTFAATSHPYRLRYVPSVQDAGVIVPFSRTGRPMLAKPEPQLAAGVDALAAIARAGRSRIHDLHDDADLIHDLREILTATAATSLLAAEGRGADGQRRRRIARAARSWLAALCDGAGPPIDPAGELERSLDVGSGRCPPDLAWAFGHSWRSLYPALVGRLGGDGLPQCAWPAFGRLASEMERVSFGPPPVNAAKLLALIAARRVDLTHVAAARLHTTGRGTSIRSQRGERPVDVVVDAVLPPPGVSPADGGLLAQLIADGHARVVAGRRGLQVAADAGCVGRDGRRSAGLAAIGRSTEDCVIGNDTLSRTLHAQADRWARRVVARSARRAGAREAA